MPRRWDSLSRNLGLVTGASVMGAVFALASGAADIATAPPQAVAAGMWITFALAAALIVGALALAAGSRAIHASRAAMVVVLAWATPVHGQTSAPSRSGGAARTPADPYPINAAGWGAPAGRGLFVSRWVEDWTGARAAGDGPPLKAMTLGGEASLTSSAEARLRHDAYSNGQRKLPV